MTDDRTLAQIAWATYDPPGHTVAWTLKTTIAGVDCRLWESPAGDQVIAFRGSDDAEDILRDLFAVSHRPADHPVLGPVHAGALIGLEELVRYLNNIGIVRPSPYLVGHSLGGMRAPIAAALLLGLGITPVRIVTFGAPRCGYRPLTDLLAPVPVGAYRNGTGAMRSDGSSFDLVTDAVPTIPVVMPYVRIREPLIDVSNPPSAGDPLGFLAWHHMSLYAGAL